VSREIDADNVTFEVRSSVTGVLSKILVKDGGSVEASTALGIDQPVLRRGIDHHLGNHLGAATDGGRKNANSRFRSLENRPWAMEPNTEFRNDVHTNIRTESRSAAFWQRHMGERRRRPPLPKQRRVGVARQPMKVS
jgi:hypothetical protein